MGCLGDEVPRESESQRVQKGPIGIDEVPKNIKEIDLSDDERKKKQSLREANERLYEELLLSIDGNEKTARVAFNLAKLAKTKDLADGDASLAWMRLKKVCDEEYTNVVEIEEEIC